MSDTALRGALRGAPASEACAAQLARAGRLTEALVAYEALKRAAWLALEEERFLARIDGLAPVAARPDLRSVAGEKVLRLEHQRLCCVVRALSRKGA